MTLIIKEKAMSLRDYEMIKVNVKKELHGFEDSHFTCWYTDSTKIGNFKILEKYRRVLEQHLYIIN